MQSEFTGQAINPCKAFHHLTSKNTESSAPFLLLHLNITSNLFELVDCYYRSFIIESLAPTPAQPHCTNYPKSRKKLFCEKTVARPLNVLRTSM